MALIVQQKALQAAAGLSKLLPRIRKRDRALHEQVLRAMSSVVLNLAEASGNDSGTARARFASACGSAKEVRAGPGANARREDYGREDLEKSSRHVLKWCHCRCRCHCHCR